MKVNIECEDGRGYTTKVTDAETGTDLTPLISGIELAIRPGPNQWMAKIEIVHTRFSIKNVSPEFALRIDKARDLLANVHRDLLNDQTKTLIANNERLECEIEDLRAQLIRQQKINHNLTDRLSVISSGGAQ